MPIREQDIATRRNRTDARPGRRSRLRRPTRWRPHLEALEPHVLLSGVNLVVSSVVAPTTLSPAGTIRVSWGVANRGTDPAGASWSDAVYLSRDAAFDDGDVLLGSPQAAPTTLGPGASYANEAGFDVPSVEPGSYYLLFVADAGGDQAEADESNNVRAVPVTITGSSTRLPDLVVTAATAPASAQAGKVDVSWTIKNQGTGDITGGWADVFYLSTDQTYDASDTSVTSYYHFNDLAAGASQSFSATIGLPGVPAGPYYLLFVADGYGGVHEGDETNNVRAVPITITVPDVDLAVTAADAPATAKAGDTVNVSWTVTNRGTDSADTGWFDHVYLSTDQAYDPYFDTYVTSSFAGGVAAGADYTRSTTVTLPPVPAGSYYLLFIADGSHDQAETDETNNVRAVPITISPLDADLEVTDAVAPASAKPGPVAISWTVTNQGSDPIGGYWTDYVYLSRDRTYDFTDSYVTSGSHYGSAPLGAGQSYTTTQTVNLPGLAPGDYYLLFIADQYNDVPETDETNNVRAVPITLTSSDVDLAVTAADAPATARAGGTAALSWTVTNRGTDATASGWNDAVYLSTDDRRDFSDRFLSAWYVSDPLEAGGSISHTATITLPSVPAGSYYLLFVTDVGNSQAETDEANNLRAVPITIEAADAGSRVDLAISGATAPGSAAPGWYVPVSWVVTNTGTAAAGASWLDGVYLSTDSTFDPSSDTALATISTASQSPLPDGRGYIVSMDVFLPAGTAPGDYHLLFVADAGGDQAESGRANNVADLAFTVAGTAAPAPTVSSFMVNDGEAQRSMVTRLTLTFGGVVTIDGDAFRLERDDGAIVGLVASSRVLDGRTVVTLTFTGDGITAGSLADGRYTLTVLSGRIHDEAGQALDGDGDGTPGGDYLDHLFRLFGDADGDGDVDNKDYLSFRSTAGRRDGDAGFLWFLDADGDGIIDLATDYEAFKAQNRKTIA